MSPGRAAARRLGATARRRTRQADRGARRLATNPWLGRAQRLGYAVRGVLYAVTGLLALALALGRPAHPTDLRGALLLLASGRWTVALLALAIVGLSAYSLWGFIRAIYDPLDRGHHIPGIAARLGFAWSGLNYAALVIFAAGFLAGSRRRGGGDPVRAAVDAALSHPGGRLAVVVAGVVGLIGGLAQFADAVRAGFRRDLKRNRMNRAERTAADALGRFGMFARGVIFSILALFVLRAGLAGSADQAHGMGAAFAALLREPFGAAALGVVALGFVALGLHSFAYAAWVRLPRDPRRLDPA